MPIGLPAIVKPDWSVYGDLCTAATAPPHKAQFRRLWRYRRSVACHGRCDALSMILRVSPRRVTEAAAKYSNEIGIVAKAAGVGDLADGLACLEKRPAFQQRHGVIQTNRLDEVAAGGVSRRKEFLKVA
jgi:hypothetical protein